MKIVESIEMKKERLKISKMSSMRITMTFEQLIREGDGGNSVPLMF